MSKLRVGILENETSITQYRLELLRHMRESNLFEDPFIIIATHVEKKSLRSDEERKRSYDLRKLFFLTNKFIARFLHGIILRIELPLVKKQRPEYGCKENLVKDNNWSKIQITGNSSSNVENTILTEQDQIKLKNLNLDVILGCGSKVLAENLVASARIGFLEITYSDNREVREWPSGLLEVLNNFPSTGFSIEKINCNQNGPDTLVRGCLMTASTWTMNQAILMAKSNAFVIKVLEEIAITRHIPSKLPINIFGRQSYKFIGSLALSKYFFFCLTPLIIKKVLSKVKGNSADRWSISYSNHLNYTKPISDFKEITNPADRFLADPFVHHSNKKTVIFAEDFCYKDNRGRISAIDITTGEARFLGTVLDEKFHLSFPFIFEDQGQVFMIPESHECNQIRLYQCKDFPMKWEFKCILMSEVKAGDTMVLKKNGKWFMLTNICSAKINDFHSELHIFHADKLQSGHWKPIASGNPVIFDSRKARNGGFFCSGDDIFRVNQIQGKNHYGKSFGINLIKNLDENFYIEDRIKNIDADFKKGINSTHHFHANDEFAVMDFCRRLSFKKRIIKR